MRYTATQLRVWNEMVILFLFGITFLVILKDAPYMVSAMLGLLGMTR